MNRGFLYGDGFFESFKVVKSVPVFWKYHYQRFLQTADYLGFENNFSEAQLILLLKDYIEEVDLVNGRLRVTFYREGMGKYLPDSNGINLDFQSNATDSISFEPIELSKLYVSPIRLPKHEMGNFKLIAKPLQVKAAMDAHRNGAEEAILLNDQNEVSEGMTGNVFLVKENRLITPSLSSGCLAGTLRAWILDSFQNVEERVIKSEEIKTSDAVLFTNAARGLMVFHQTNRWNGYQEMLARLNADMLNSIRDFAEIQP